MNWCEDPYWTKGQYLSVLDLLSLGELLQLDPAICVKRLVQ